MLPQIFKYKYTPSMKMPITINQSSQEAPYLQAKYYPNQIKDQQKPNPSHKFVLEDMNATRRPVVDQRIYDDIVPSHDSTQGDKADTIIIDVPGFQKEQIRVLIDKSGKLKVIGERPLVENKWIRFCKEFEIPKNCNKTEIRAKFEKGHVHITLPKHVVDMVPPPKDQATQTTTQDKKATEPKLSSTDQTEHSKKANENEQREEKRSDRHPLDAQNKVEDKKADQATQTTTEDKKVTEPKLPSTDRNGHSRKANGEQREEKRSDPPLIDAQNKVEDDEAEQSDKDSKSTSDAASEAESFESAKSGPKDQRKLSMRLRTFKRKALKSAYGSRKTRYCAFAVFVISVSVGMIMLQLTN